MQRHVADEVGVSEDKQGYVYIPLPRRVAKELHSIGCQLIPASGLHPHPFVGGDGRALPEAGPEELGLHLTLATQVSERGMSVLEDKGVSAAPITVELGRLGVFQGGRPFDVLKIDVVCSAAVSALQQEILSLAAAEAEESREYNPHVSIAFCQTGAVSEKALKIVEDKLRGLRWEADTLVCHIDGLLPKHVHLQKRSLFPTIVAPVVAGVLTSYASHNLWEVVSKERLTKAALQVGKLSLKAAEKMGGASDAALVEHGTRTLRQVRHITVIIPGVGAGLGTFGGLALSHWVQSKVEWLKRVGALRRVLSLMMGGIGYVAGGAIGWAWSVQLTVLMAGRAAAAAARQVVLAW